MLSPGQLITLRAEKPAVGGAMIARLEGQVVLVEGAIPGERLTARVERVGKGVAYARTVSVDEPSPDRREAFTDPRCGGCLYAHVEYPRQLLLKAQVVADAFARIGRLALPSTVDVAPSPESGYRMRARLHLSGTRVGFFREGSHEICDPRATRQLLPETSDVVERLAVGLGSLGVHAVREMDVSENVEATERAIHLELASPIDARPLVALLDTTGVTGLTISRQSPVGSRQSPVGTRRSASSLPPSTRSRVIVVGGDPRVTDVLSIDSQAMTLGRHVLSFFQGNRYLLHDLVAHVVGLIDRESDVVDLYAGVGVFAVAAGVAGARVIAVEGDPVAAADLDANARASGGAVEPVCQPVEVFAARTRARPRTLIVDPPRTGLSPEALQGALRLGAGRLVYVSCDVATLARDARRLVDAGHAIEHVRAFDMFPNTPHVETVVVFRRT